MAEPVALKCPSCASALTFDDFDPVRGFIKCSYCGALVSFRNPGSGDSRARDSAPRPPIPLPGGVSLAETIDGLEIMRRWFTPAAIFLLFFCVAWDGFLVFWYATVFKTHGPVIAAVFPLLHVAIGVGVSYLTLAKFVNATRITLGRGRLEVSHGPLPWAGGLTIDSTTLAQLYCKEQISRGRNGPQYRYEVWGVLKDGAHRKLVAADLQPEQALYIEQELERTLRIRDQAVPGELARY